MSQVTTYMPCVNGGDSVVPAAVARALTDPRWVPYRFGPVEDPLAEKMVNLSGAKLLVANHKAQLRFAAARAQSMAIFKKLFPGFAFATFTHTVVKVADFIKAAEDKEKE